MGEERFHTRGLPGEGHLPGQRHVGAELPRLVPQPPPLQLGGELLPQGEKLRAGLRPQPPQAALLGELPYLGEPQRQPPGGKGLQGGGGVLQAGRGHLPQKGQGQVEVPLCRAPCRGRRPPQPLLDLGNGLPGGRGEAQGEKEPHSSAWAHWAS